LTLAHSTALASSCTSTGSPPHPPPFPTRRSSDLLVATTIVESGLDIPNANTLVIDRADMYGLSQLHQLRGRVGRGSERAYAYFLDRKSTRLNSSHGSTSYAVFCLNKQT